MSSLVRAVPVVTGVEHRFVEVSGLRMHVAEAGQGDPVVLLHGFPQHWWEWRDVMPRLAQRYHVIAPDLRGFGWTEAPATGYDSEHFLADLIGLLDVLRLDRVHVVGHDWGAILGFRLSLVHPDRVRTHLAMSIPPPFTAMDPRIAKVAWRMWFDFVLVTPGLGPWSLRKGGLARTLMTGNVPAGRRWSEEELEQFAGQFRDPARARAGAALYRSFILPEAMRMMRKPKDGLRLTTRTRLLLGAEDPIVRPEFVHGYEPYVDDLTVGVVAGAGHFLVDDRPDTVADAAYELIGS